MPAAPAAPVVELDLVERPLDGTGPDGTRPVRSGAIASTVAISSPRATRTRSVSLAATLVASRTTAPSEVCTTA
ncbi:hypothetical protein CHMI_03772 [Cellulomonas hominis]|nr:hypothetical protein CHMI_03772 [Cellulomonas hominis]